MSDVLRKLFKRPEVVSNGQSVDIVGRRKLWYAISIVFIAVGIGFLAVFGLRFGIDFTGGSEIDVGTDKPREEVVEIVEAEGVENPQVIESETGYQIRFIEDIDIEAALNEAGLEVTRFERVGPSVSRDLARISLYSLAAVSLAIMIYIAFAFRKVEHPFRFGSMAIVALLHDALFVLGMFALLGAVAGVEVDAFIITAVLTVIGFSVHDTIVVFDRIRENLIKREGNFARIVNDSVNEVMVRSLNTSITTVVVLLALFLFGGASTANFILALLLGMVSGTYSSIFIASPLLVTWQKLRHKFSSAAVR